MYWALGVILVAAAVIGLGTVAYDLVRDLADGPARAIVAALDGVLLVFILVELLGGLRATVTEHQLVAEPFLVVGIIASIKEILVTALAATRSRGRPGGAFDDAMLEIAVLSGAVLILGITMLFVRRKEREPEEAG